MDFLNRTLETSRLSSILKNKSPKLIVVYGRRRLGKTRLLQELMETEDIYFISDQRERPLQIKAFAKQVAYKLPDFDKAIYTDWESFFISLRRQVNENFTLFIDEFPYLVKNAPELPSILQKLKDSPEGLPFHLVLCGSSQQMMQKMVLDHSSALYGRSNEILKITPLNIYYLKKALKCSYKEAIEEYAVWGGVPRYWELRLQQNSLQEAIIHHIFDIHGILHEEPLRLFLDDTRDSVQMHTLISIIATGAHRLSEIASRIGKPATQLNRPLQRLIELGYIKREIPFGMSKRNTKKSLYKIAEPFILFYYRFVLPEITSLELGYTKQIYQHTVKEQFPDHCAETWEELCRQAIPVLFKNNFFSPGSRWWGNDCDNNPAEIDIISESYDKKELIIGEVKWSSNRNIKAIVKKLNEKVEKFPGSKNRTIRKTLFLKEKVANVPFDYYVFSPKEVIETFKT